MSFQDPFGSCLRLFVSVRRISDLLPTSLFFLLALPSWRILPPRRSLSEELRRVDGDAIKESGSFDERTETSMEEATAYPFAPSERTKVCIREFTLRPAEKSTTSGAEKYFAASRFPFSIFWRRVPADVILRETFRRTTYRNYFWPTATIPHSMSWGSSIRAREQTLSRAFRSCIANNTKYTYKYN